MTTLSKNTRNEINMPLVGFGTYQLSTEEAEQSVAEALKAGYRHIDSAEGYQNEAGTGRALKASGLSRDDFFLTTKLLPGNKQWGVAEKTYDQTIETLKGQLQDLQVDYVDLYLIHAPLSTLRLEQWEALVALKKSGLAKHIGVSNYDEVRINEIKNAGLDLPEANQIEFHPLNTQRELTEFMRSKSISPIAYSSLAPLANWRMAEGQGGEVLAEKKEASQKTIRDIANELNVAESKLLLRWALQHDYSILTRSTKPQHIKGNIDLFDFEIGQDQMDRLDQLNQNQPFAWAANGLNPMEAAPAL